MCTGGLAELMADCPCTPSSTWLHACCGPELELPHLSVLDDLVPPNQPLYSPSDCFNPGRTSPESWLVSWWCLQSLGRSRMHAAGCGPSAARHQPGCVDDVSGEKVLVCKSSIPNPIPLCFCPGSWFYCSLLSRARLRWPHCRRQQDGVELAFFFSFFSKSILPRAAPPKLLWRRWKSRGTRPCTCCASISVILQLCQHKHHGQPRLSALITRRRGRTYGWAVAAHCARRQLANLLVLQDFSGNKPKGKTSLVR